MKRRVDASISLETASRTTGKRLRIPVWNRSGASSRTRNWLNCRPKSGMKVEMRNTSGATSWMLVPASVAALISISSARVKGIRMDGASVLTKEVERAGEALQLGRVAQSSV